MLDFQRVVGKTEKPPLLLSMACGEKSRAVVAGRDVCPNLPSLCQRPWEKSTSRQGEGKDQIWGVSALLSAEGSGEEPPRNRHVEANPGVSVVRQGEGPTPVPLRVSVPTRNIGVGGTGVCVTDMSLETGWRICQRCWCANTPQAQWRPSQGPGVGGGKGCLTKPRETTTDPLQPRTLVEYPGAGLSPLTVANPGCSSEDLTLLHHRHSITLLHAQSPKTLSTNWKRGARNLTDWALSPKKQDMLSLKRLVS